MEKNGSKHLSYAEAWRRIKRAKENGYYFEVVALCESIISDRVLSYVKSIPSETPVNIHTPFAKIIAKWRKSADGNLPEYGSIDLGQAVDSWRRERNAVIHSLAKSEPGTPTPAVDSFLLRAQRAAETGAHLAKKVSNWHKSELRKHKARLRHGK